MYQKFPKKYHITSQLTEKISHHVLKDCYKELKSDLSEEVVDALWTQNWLSAEEFFRVKSCRSHFERNEILIDILMTK